LYCKNQLRAEICTRAIVFGHVMAPFSYSKTRVTGPYEM
jgi:hypothetical protein